MDEITYLKRGTLKTKVLSPLQKEFYFFAGILLEILRETKSHENCLFRENKRFPWEFTKL